MDKVQASAMAKVIVEKYGTGKTANELIEQAFADGMFKNEKEALTVWGRMNRLVRQ